MDGDGKKSEELAKMLIGHYAAYNHHKENMAYAGVLLEVGLFVGIVTIEQWPTSYLLQFNRWLLVFGVFVLWLLIHLFIGWQLMNRKVGAKRVVASVLYLCGSKRCGTSSPESESSSSSWEKIIQMFIWWIDLKYEGDIKKDKVLNEFTPLFEQRKAGTRPEELILWFGSILMFVVILLRTLPRICIISWLQQMICTLLFIVFNGEI